MTSRFKHILITLFLSIIFIEGKTQSNSIELITYRGNDRILLRWAPSSSSDWLELNNAGYALERYTIIRDSVRVYPPESILISELIKPADLREWEAIAEENDYAAIVAQSIYGESFEADTENSGIISLIQKSKEQDMRYSFAILASDQSFEVAQLAGLAYEDKNIKSREAYLYKLYGNFRNQISDTVYAIVDARESPPLPKVRDIETEFGDRIVTLSWSTDYLESVYSSYIVEKSRDGTSFHPIQDLPSVTASPTESKKSQRMVKIDSLEENGVKYYYRIKGRSPFGMVGPPSEEISGVGQEKFKLSLGITESKVSNEGIRITWNIDMAGSKNIKEFVIYRSSDAKEFEMLDIVEKSRYSYLDREPYSSNYYKVAALSIDGQIAESHPYFVQTEDSIPPGVPSGLLGISDTTGAIILKWNKVETMDISGYRVYRSRVKDSEYRQVTVSAISDTLFVDSVNLNTLSKKIYYKIQSVDNRGNRSDLSEEKLVMLADIVAPTSPRISSYNIDKSNIEISWINSSSKDAVSTIIYRTNDGEEQLLTEISMSSGITSYVDSSNVSGNMIYYLTSVDSSGNVSSRSNEIEVFKPSSAYSENIKLKVEVDRKNENIHLQWNSHLKEGIVKVYRSREGEPISLYK
ncbi:MAG: hypothetical protein ABFS32_14675, partial [Bacteroidota bacterium]